MGIKRIRDETLQDIANAIKSKTGSTEPIKTNEMANAIGSISVGGDDRYDEGFSDGKTEGVEEGKQAEYDRFWNVYQENGERKAYRSAFVYSGWTPENFKPKYPMKPTYINSMFASATNLNIDLRDYCILDMSDCVETSQAFSGSAITAVGVFDLKTSTNNTRGTPADLFYGARNLETIEKIIFYKDVKYRVNNIFNSCVALKEVRFEGELLYPGMSFSLKDSTLLSKESIVSCINVLSNEATGYTVTFSQVAVDKAFETSEGANDGSTSDEWNSLVATKQPSWTISLV